MWKMVCLMALKGIISQRKMFEKNMLAATLYGGLKFYHDSMEEIVSGKKTEAEMAAYWQSLGIDVQAEYDRYEAARDEFLAEGDP